MRGGAVVWIFGALLFMTGFGGQAEGAVILDSSLSVSERYNDNLFFTEADRDADFTTLVIPSMGLTYDSRNLTLSVTYRGSAEFHARHPEANIYAQTVSFALDLPILSRQIKGVDVQVTENVTYTPELPAFTFGDEQEEGEGIQVRRTDTFRNRAGIAVGYTVSPKLRTTISYRNGITRYRGAELQDTVDHEASVGGEYQWSLRTQWTASYRESVTIFERDEEVVIHRLRIGAGHQINPLLSVNGRLVVAFVRDKSPQLIFRAELSKRYKKGSIKVRYINDIGTGGGLITDITRSQRLVGQLTQAVGQNASAYLQLGYGNNRSLSGQELKVSTYTVGTGLSVRFLSWLRGGLSYSYLNQQSKGSVGEDGQRNVVTIILTATGPSWRIVQ